MSRDRDPGSLVELEVELLIRNPNPLPAVATEGIETVQDGDKLTGGKYLAIETVAEIADEAGSRAQTPARII
jgi:hypothetical protein